MRLKIAIIAAILCGVVANPAGAGQGASVPGRAIEGLRDCPGGGVILPGSETCLRLGGRVRADAVVATDSQRSVTRRSLTHFGTTARIEMDARTPTEFGPVRVFTAVRVGRPSP